MFNVKDILSLDKFNLDHELERQAGNMQLVTEELAQAVYERDLAKERWENRKSEVALDVRQNPEDYDIDGKPPEHHVKELVRTDPEVRKLAKEMFKLEKEVGTLFGIREAMTNKKIALEYMTKLFLSGYYAEPHVSNDDMRQTKHKAHREKLGANKRLAKRKQNKEE